MKKFELVPKGWRRERRGFPGTGDVELKTYMCSSGHKLRLGNRVWGRNSTVIRALDRLEDINLELDDTFVIQGPEPVGLAFTLLRSLAGFKHIIIIGDDATRLEVRSCKEAWGSRSYVSLWENYKGKKKTETGRLRAVEV